MRDRETLAAAAQAIIGVIVIGGALWLYLARPAYPHSFYEYSCCHDKDCRPVPDGAITEGPNGYVVKATGEVIPYTDKRVRQSPDQNFHWCSVAGLPDSRTLCIYAPGRGF